MSLFCLTKVSLRVFPISTRDSQRLKSIGRCLALQHCRVSSAQESGAVAATQTSPTVMTKPHPREREIKWDSGGQTLPFQSSSVPVARMYFHTMLDAGEVTRACIPPPSVAEMPEPRSQSLSLLARARQPTLAPLSRCRRTSF